MSNRTDRIESQAIDSRGKSVKRRLAADVHLTCSRDRLTEGDVELSVFAFAGDLPGHEVVALYIEDLTRSLQQDAQRVQLALKNLVVDSMILAKQPSTESGFDLAGGMCGRAEIRDGLDSFTAVDWCIP